MNIVLGIFSGKNHYGSVFNHIHAKPLSGQKAACLVKVQISSSSASVRTAGYSQGEVKSEHTLTCTARRGQNARSAHRQRIFNQPLLLRSFSGKVIYSPVKNVRHVLHGAVQLRPDGFDSLPYMEIIEVRRVAVKGRKFRNDNGAAAGLARFFRVFNSGIVGYTVAQPPAVIISADDELFVMESGHEFRGHGNDISGIHSRENVSACSLVNGACRGVPLADISYRAASVQPRKTAFKSHSRGKALLEARHFIRRRVYGLHAAETSIRIVKRDKEFFPIDAGIRSGRYSFGNKVSVSPRIARTRRVVFFKRAGNSFRIFLGTLLSGEPLLVLNPFLILLNFAL